MQDATGLAHHRRSVPAVPCRSVQAHTGMHATRAVERPGWLPSALPLVLSLGFLLTSLVFLHFEMRGLLADTEQLRTEMHADSQQLLSEQKAAWQQLCTEMHADSQQLLSEQKADSQQLLSEMSPITAAVRALSQEVRSSTTAHEGVSATYSVNMLKGAAATLGVGGVWFAGVAGLAALLRR